jgi:hypothetical protein
MPACAASCASATRWWRRPTPTGGALEPPALVDRAAAAGPSRHWQTSCEPTTRGADDAAGQRAQRPRRRPAAAAGRHRAAARRARLCWRGRCRCTHARLRRGLVSVQDAARSWRAAAAGRLRRRPAAAHPGCLRRARRQDRPHPGAGDAQVLALDVDPARCERIHENLQRLGLQAECAPPMPASRRLVGRPAFDAILLDAPCTAPASCGAIPTCAGCAAKATSRSWRRSRPGCWRRCGRCSRRAAGWSTAPARFSGEGEAAVRAFVAHNKTAVLRPAPGHLCPKAGQGRCRPGQSRGDHDGFITRCWKRSRRLERAAC